MKEQSTAIKNIYNHLKPTGRIFFIMSAQKDGLPFDQALKFTTKNWKAYFQEFHSDQIFNDIEFYRRIIVDAGFSLNNISLMLIESKFSNSESLKGWIKQWLPHYKYLGDEVKEKFIDELLDCYLLDPRCYSKSEDLIWRDYAIVVNAVQVN